MMQTALESNGIRLGRRPRCLVSGLALLTAVAAVLPCGCVRRRMTVRSNPPGALVSVDNQVIGTTPAATSFTYYGTREIRVQKDGYRSEVLQTKVSPPWYQYPGLDFVTETLWPWEVRDERMVDVELVPLTLEPAGQVVERADQLRQQSRSGVITGPR